MIIYCLVLQSTTWMSSAWMDSLGNGSANDGLWHPCLFILSCLLPLSAYVRLCWQNDSCSSARSGEGSGFAKCLLFCKKKKNCKFLPRAVFLTCFTAFPHKQLSWQSYRGTVLQLGNQEKCRGWNETAIPPAITATGDKTLQPYILLLAWLGLSGTLESYLALLHLSASISDAVKWNHQWSPNLVKIWAANEALSVNVCRICYVAHAWIACKLCALQTYLHMQFLSYGHFLVSEAGLGPEADRTTSLGILFSC